MAMSTALATLRIQPFRPINGIFEILETTASTSNPQVAMRAPAYGIPGVTIDGNDAVEVFLVMQDAIARARAGDGPTLVEAMTYRWGQHSMRANLRDPRPEDEF